MSKTKAKSDELVELVKAGKIHTSLKCKNCGEEISQYGPETFHTESTLIRCNINEGDAKRAEA